MKNMSKDGNGGKRPYLRIDGFNVNGLSFERDQAVNGKGELKVKKILVPHILVILEDKDGNEHMEAITSRSIRPVTKKFTGNGEAADPKAEAETKDKKVKPQKGKASKPKEKAEAVEAK